jgi:hypothetical protein
MVFNCWLHKVHSGKQLLTGVWWVSESVSVREGITGRTYQCCHTARPNDARFSTYLLHVQHYTMYKIRYKTCRNKMLICSCGVPPKSCSRVTRWHACHSFAIPHLESQCRVMTYGEACVTSYTDSRVLFGTFRRGTALSACWFSTRSSIPYVHKLSQRLVAHTVDSIAVKFRRRFLIRPLPSP